MYKIIYQILVFLLLANFVLADSIILKSPSDGKTLTTESQDFIFQIDSREKASICSLFTNDIKKKSFGNVANEINIKMDISLDSGNYDWYIECTINENIIRSETQSLIIDIPEKEDVSDVKVTSGGIGKGLLYTFDWFPESKNQKDVVLEEVIIGDTLEFLINGDRGNNFRVYMILISSGKDTPELKFKTSSTNLNTVVKEGETVELDITGNKETDVFMKIDTIYSTAKADIILSRIPGSSDNIIPDEEPVDDEEQPVVEIIRNGEVVEEDVVKEFDPTKQQNQRPRSNDEELVINRLPKEERDDNVESNPPTGLLILVIILLLIIIFVAILKLGAKGKTKRQPQTAATKKKTSKKKNAKKKAKKK